MGSAAAAEDNNDNGMDRVLTSSSIDDRYPYSRNYVAIIEPDNFVSLSAITGIDSITEALSGASEFLQGTSIVQFGNVFDPADIAIVNRFNGVQVGDIGFPTGALRASLQASSGVDILLGSKFAGNRQPKSPIPPGDKAYFFHGECVALSVSAPSNENVPGSVDEISDDFVDGLVQSSHTCNLNLCLGGGGFDCIAIYAGTAFTFNLGQQIGAGSSGDFGNAVLDVIPSVPPPFPATIIGGTGSFEGIEGTVDIATICGTSGINISSEGTIKVGYIVQSIKVKSNMPLPVAP